MKRVCLSWLIVTAAVWQAAYAQQTVGAAEAIAELQQQIGVRDQVIRNLIRRLEELEQAVGGLQAAAASGTEVVQAAAPVRTDAAQAAAAAAELDLERLRTAFERTLLDRGGLVLPDWTLELDAGLSYSHSSSETLTIDGFTVFPVLVVGDIVSERVRRDTMTASLTGRLGLPGQWQAEMRVPYIREQASRLDGSGEEARVSGSGLGDVELGLSRQLWRSADASFDVLGTVRWKSTTGPDAFGMSDTRVPLGSGFHSLSASMTAVSVLDPVVFFGGLSYTANLADEKDGVRVDPGDSLGLQLGTALALNLDTSINFSFGQQFTRRTRVAGADVPGSYVNTGTFSVGLSRVLSGGTSLDSSLSIGLSEDSPDLQLAFSMPFRQR